MPYFVTVSFACVCVNVRARECSKNLIRRYTIGDAIGDGALPRPSRGGCLMGTTAIPLSSLFLFSSLRRGPMARACGPTLGPQMPDGLQGPGSTAQGAGEAEAWPWPPLPLPRWRSAPLQVDWSSLGGPDQGGLGGGGADQRDGQATTGQGD